MQFICRRDSQLQVGRNAAFVRVTLVFALPSQVIRTFGRSYSFLDIGPLSKGHALIIPKRGKSNLSRRDIDSMSG